MNIPPDNNSTTKNYFQQTGSNTFQFRQSTSVQNLLGVKPFSNDTIKNLYKNYSLDTVTCQVAQQYIGKQEVTLSQYKNLSDEEKRYTQIDLIGKDTYYLNSSWCALSMDTILKKSGINIIDPDIDTVEKNGKGAGVYATVDEFVAWGNKKKTYHQIDYSKKREPQILNQMQKMHEGDFIIWKHNRSHIGLIESVDLERGTVTTLEGNANTNKSNNRDGFIRKVYTFEQLSKNGYSGYIDNSRLYKKS